MKCLPVFRFGLSSFKESINIHEIGNMLFSASYTTMLGDQRRLRIAKLIWSSIVLPRHRFITWLKSQTSETIYSGRDNQLLPL